MRRCRVYRDEMYPCFGISECWSDEEGVGKIEIPDDLYIKYLEVEKVYAEMQDILETLYNEN